MLVTEEWQQMFEDKVAADPTLPHPVAVMQVIQDMLYLDDSTTVQELVERMKYVRKALINSPSASLAVETAGEMFTKFITRAPSLIEDAETFEDVRIILQTRGADLLDNIKGIPGAVGAFALRKLFPPCAPPAIIFTHSRHPCVQELCLQAYQKGFAFKVYVTEGRPNCYGTGMVRDLRAAGVNAELVMDAAAAYYMEQSTLVVLGAQAVCPNGGVIGEIGTSSMACIATALRMRVYILAESYRFTYHSPLNNRHLTPRALYGNMFPETPKDTCPRIDYTRPEYVSTILSDIQEVNPEVIEDILLTMFI